jgi:hypothetical protein
MVYKKWFVWVSMAANLPCFIFDICVDTKYCTYLEYISVVCIFDAQFNQDIYTNKTNTNDTRRYKTSINASKTVQSTSDPHAYVKGSWDRVAFSNVIADSIPQPCEATVDV